MVRSASLRREWLLVACVVMLGAVGSGCGTIGDGSAPIGEGVCTGIEVLCSGQCTNVRGDRDNCGACGVVCEATEICSIGACLPREDGCVTGEVECDGQCIDPLADPVNCGACGSVCPFDQVCALGECTAVCPRGTLACDGGCVDPQTDLGFCGATGDCVGDSVGQVCPPAPDGFVRACDDGVCTALCPGDEILCRGQCQRECTETVVHVGTMALLEPHGGDGGNPSVLACPTGSLVVGMYGVTGDRVHQFGAICAAVHIDGSLGEQWQSPILGSDEGDDFLEVCPAGEVMVGLRGRSDTLVNRIGADCAPLSAWLAHGTFGTRLDSHGGSEGERFEESCPQGMALAALDVRTGTRLDRIGGVCVAVTETAVQK